MDRDNLMTALRNAHTAGDTVSAQRLAQMIHSLDAKPERSFGEMLYENVVGRGEVDTVGEKIGEAFYENVFGRGEADTVGEKLGQYIRGGGAATARGIADIPALPVNVAQLGAMGVEKALGMEEPSMVSRGLAALPDTRDMLGVVPVIGPESRYVAPDTAGEYISTAGEFMGGAGVSAGPRAMMKYGATAGLASEAAGQATEGEAIEPYARAAAAIVSPSVASGLHRLGQKAVSPAAGEISPARQQALDILKDEGVTPTAGQAIGGTAAQQQLYREAATAAGRARSDEALGDFTEAVMRRLGSTHKRATPEALQEADDRIGAMFNSIVEGVDVIPSRGALVQMNEALDKYKELAPALTAAPIFQNVQRALNQSAVSGIPIPADVVKTWRTTMSELTTSSDAPMRRAAISSIEALDDSIESALIAARKPEAIAQLREARGHYRNLMAIGHAAKRADVSGVLSPLQLRTALLQQNHRQYTRGKGDLGPLTRSAADVLQPLPNSGTQQRLSAGEIFGGASSGTFAGLGSAALGADPMIAAGIGLGATLAPVARNRFLSSDAGQRYFQNQLLRRAQPVNRSERAAPLAGLLSQAADPAYNPLTFSITQPANQ